MRRLSLFLIIILASLYTKGQIISNLSFGTDSTLDVITWNIENFPKDGQTTINNVIEILDALDADVYALQEISDTGLFRQVLDNLEDYEGYFESGLHGGGLAYVYKSSTVTVNYIYGIYNDNQYWRPFPRAPFVMEMEYMGEDYLLINNHLKCCGDGIIDLNDPDDEETRRLEACTLLKSHIDNYHPGERVIVLGDWNDDLADDVWKNVFQDIIDDYISFKFVDMDIAYGTSYNWSYPGWPSHLDHILITNELFYFFTNDTSGVMTILVDEHLPGGWSAYDARISDHLPVGMRLNVDVSADISEETASEAYLSNFPNPVLDNTTISFGALHENTSIEIYNTHGRLIESITIHPTQNSVVWNRGNHPAGMYLLRLEKENGQRIAHKMLLSD